MSSKRTVKVAVIGSGLAGLTVAHLLSQPCLDKNVVVEVYVFEKSATLGMDSESISVSEKATNGDRMIERRIDVPMRSFQGGYYPNVEKLYRRLGVSFRVADFTYSFSTLSTAKDLLGRRISTWFIYNGASGRAGLGIPSSFQNEYQKSSGHTLSRVRSLFHWLVSTVLVGICFVRLLFLSLPVWKNSELQNMTFEGWARKTRLKNFPARLVGLDRAWEQFTNDLLLPLFSAVCTAPTDTVLEHPVEEFLDYIWLTLGTSHYKVTNGVQEVVKKLTSNDSNLILSCEILAILPDPRNAANQVSIHCERNGIHCVFEGFDHVVLATQACRAVPLLDSYATNLPASAPSRDCLENLIDCLRTFKYHRNVVINHTDRTMLPGDQVDWRELNFIVADTQFPGEDEEVESSGRTVKPAFVMTTQILQGSCGQLYQTTNPVIPPKEESILSISYMDRAVVTTASKRALAGLWTQDPLGPWETPIEKPSKLGPLQGAGKLQDPLSRGPGIWICGSYAYPGIPLLEGCVVSARNVVEQGVLASENTGLVEEPW